MKKEWKKILSLVLALAMVLSTCTFVFAEGEDVLGDELPVDDLSVEEILNATPLAAYEEETVLIYPQTTQVDLSRTNLNPDEAKGTIEYAVTGNTDVLSATKTPGVYDLTGAFNYDGEAAVVTAGYYSPGKSSANNDSPRYTTSTKVYVKPASVDYAVFDGYDVFDLSEMTYEMDEAFIIPYYSYASERELYGTIDLGLTEQWKGATVTISDTTKFEYLGDGCIRALASHTWTEAGGTQGAEDATTTVRTFNDKGDLTSKRDKMSMGTPIVMTVTAPDGGVKKFGLWAFPTTVQGDLTAEGADPNAYKLNATSTSMSNAIVSVEVYNAAGNFTPTYKDPNGGYPFVPHADHRYTNTHAQPRMDGYGTIYLPTSKANYWNNYASNQEWPGWNGVAQTFTAPKDGIITLTGYFPADGRIYNGATTVMINQNQFFNLSVGLYDTDGTLISKVWQQKYGTRDVNATAWGRMDTPVVDTNHAILIDDEDETLCVEVKKGQKIRVMIDLDLNWNPNYISFGGDYAIKPVWTYYEETFTDPPMDNYDEETVLAWPDVTQVDLTRAITNSAAKGTMEYTLSGNSGVLYETATPGVYRVTGELNLGGDPAIVTAAYYSPFKSSAKEDEPLFTTSTKVYVAPASLGTDTFTMAPNFKTTGLGLAYDSYQLPYYANVTERSIYGVVDLGFTDDWKGSTVTFSTDGKFEYLGNGRIRAIARHNYSDAGKKSVDSTVTGTTAAGNTVSAYRDKNTVGTPVVMTVTAPDGGSRKFGLWSFDAQVQSTAGNSYTFSTSAPFANDVVAMEAVVADGTFKKMLPDSGAHGYIASPTADVMFEQYRPAFKLEATGWIFGDTGSGYWQNYASTSDYAYVDYDGFSTAFTAPKDGSLTVSTFWPVLGAAGTGSPALAEKVISNPLSHEIRVYNADGTYETKYTVVYEADSVKANLRLFNTIKSQTPGTNVTFDNKGTEDIADDTVTFDVKKGQVVRVLLTTKAGYNANNIQVKFENLPLPTFTYNQTTVDAIGDTIVATPVVGNTTLTGDNVLALIYNAAGELVQTAKGNDVTVENGKVSVTVTDSTAAYAKLFFFDSLENIQPLASDIVVRK